MVHSLQVAQLPGDLSTLQYSLVFLIFPRSALSTACCTSGSWAITASYSLLSRSLLPLFWSHTFYLPNSPVPSFMQVRLSLSVVSLANSLSLDPFPEHLKERKLAEVVEIKAFKPGYRTNVFAVPHKLKSLERDLLPFCSG